MSSSCAVWHVYAQGLLLGHCKWITIEDWGLCFWLCAYKHQAGKLRAQLWKSAIVPSCLKYAASLWFFSRLKSLYSLPILPVITFVSIECRSLITLMRQCPMLTGHTCITAPVKLNAILLLFSPSWPALPQEAVGAFRFMSSWLCEKFVFLIPALYMVEDWHVVSHLASPSTSTKEEPVFQQLLQTDSLVSLPKGMSLKAF